MEHLWPHLKDKLYELYPEVALWRGGGDQIAERTEDALVHHAWSCVRDQNCIQLCRIELRLVSARRGAGITKHHPKTTIAGTADGLERGGCTSA